MRRLTLLFTLLPLPLVPVAAAAPQDVTEAADSRSALSKISASASTSPPAGGVALGTASDTLASADPEAPIRRFKRQAVQSVSVSGGWLGATDSDSLSTRFLETSVQLGVPLGSFDHILGVTPSLRVDRVDAGAVPDVPAELYDAGVSLFFRRPIHERLRSMAIVRPAIRSDFTTGDQAFRIFGLGLLTWDCVPDRLAVSGGAVFLDRADLPLLPAVGLTWTPDPRSRLELRFPESRYSFRIRKDGCRSETRLFASAGIGGNTWAVTRENRSSDELSLRDIRLTVGLDHIVDGGGGWFVETGWAFRRRLEYERTATELSLSDAIVLQAGWRY